MNCLYDRSTELGKNKAEIFRLCFYILEIKIILKVSDTRMSEIFRPQQ